LNQSEKPVISNHGLFDVRISFSAAGLTRKIYVLTASARSAKKLLTVGSPAQHGVGVGHQARAPKHAFAARGGKVGEQWGLEFIARSSFENHVITTYATFGVVLASLVVYESRDSA
jgi:hypothetical protein